jgi:5-(aminomethyl)-3-furanmethanol phosphate kinase
MSLNAVLKIGGSLSRGEGLEVLCREIRRLGERYRILIVPGGGAFADQVRAASTRFKLSETTAHCMALCAMDQYGYLLNHLIAGSYLTAELPSACRATEGGKVSILLPSMPVLQYSGLPHSWHVTSDTISAWVTHQADCRRLVLLKDVDGLLGAAPGKEFPSALIPELTPDQLAACSGGVDEYLSRYLASVHLETWVINGLCPERVTELLEKGHTTGTRIWRS